MADGGLLQVCQSTTAQPNATQYVLVSTDMQPVSQSVLAANNVTFNASYNATIEGCQVAPIGNQVKSVVNADGSLSNIEYGATVIASTRTAAEFAAMMGNGFTNPVGDYNVIRAYSRVISGVTKYYIVISGRNSTNTAQWVDILGQ